MTRRAWNWPKKVFGDWQAAGDQPELKLAEPPAAEATHIYLVDRPSLTQSQIFVGQLGITPRIRAMPLVK